MKINFFADLKNVLREGKLRVKGNANHFNRIGRRNRLRGDENIILRSRA